jgi:hypothetical protein
MTVDMLSRNITGRASGLRLCGRHEEGNLGMRFIEAAGVELESEGFRQQIGKRGSNLLRILKSQFF